MNSRTYPDLSDVTANPPVIVLSNVSVVDPNNPAQKRWRVILRLSQVVAFTLDASAAGLRQGVASIYLTDGSVLSFKPAVPARS